MPLAQRWRTALKNAGLFQSEWSLQHGWTDGHVSQVVWGKRDSPPVMKEVLAFIETQERAMAERAPRAPRRSVA